MIGVPRLASHFRLRLGFEWWHDDLVSGHWRWLVRDERLSAEVSGEEKIIVVFSKLARAIGW